MSLNKVNISQMQIAYKELYMLENLLRKYVVTELNRRLGHNWENKIKKYKLTITKKEFIKLHFHELLSFISFFNNLYFDLSEKLIHELKQLNLIRNKIAHCTLLTSLEQEKLHIVYLQVLDELKRVRR
ncbi:Swt1 family HEPN domain-containing protein [Bacillus sp. Marseille-Q3570]|uniref:Swt1 family HEPN domain-containing protein n=1 Tax=Bacillus sp. Marseille-Q3570 TaxID=2963522 RepID=UPI0021B776BE|nr:Swt1 family HEPN domain-containing protein [Bacillus sp. Marseille-Q3570]